MEFFATSHGKSACDSIGGTDKQLVTKASLQRPYTELILTADAIVNFYEVNIPGIKFFNVKSEEVSESPVTLQGRFLKARTVKGTQQYRRFISVKKSSLHVYKLRSQEERPDLAHTSSLPEVEVEESNTSMEIKEQNFLCWLDDSFPCIAIGMVYEISD